MMHTLDLLCLFVGLAAGAAVQAPGATKAGDEQGIRQTIAEFVAAWNAHDATAFAKAFAADADFTNVMGTGAHGRAAIEAHHAPIFATWFKDSHVTATDVTTRFLTPDLAAVDVRWEMTGARTPDGKEIPLRKGLLNFIMTRSGDRWEITVMHNMDLDPKASPMAAGAGAPAGSRSAKGTFDAKMTPQPAYDTTDGVSLGRIAVAKTFQGPLEGTSTVEMLTGMSPVKGSGAYVAIERFTGKLDGRAGSFVMSHVGTMTRGEAQLTVLIVPDTGTGELAGIAGTLKIDIVEGKHFYTVDYTLTEAPKP
jgi:uncharacterized protein (TIGR02246 family)